MRTRCCRDDVDEFDRYHQLQKFEMRISCLYTPGGNAALGGIKSLDQCMLFPTLHPALMDLYMDECNTAI